MEIKGAMKENVKKIRRLKAWIEVRVRVTSYNHMRL